MNFVAHSFKLFSPIATLKRLALIEGTFRFCSTKASLCSLEDKPDRLEMVLSKLSERKPPKAFMKRYTLPELDCNWEESDVVENLFVAPDEDNPFSKENTANCVELKHVPTNAIVKVQSFRVLELNRQLARQLLAEKVDLMTKGESSVIHEYQERRREMEQMQRQKRVQMHDQKQKRINDWSSGFGRKFNRGGNNFHTPRFDKGNYSKRTGRSDFEFDED